MSLTIQKRFDETGKCWDIKLNGEVDISNADQLRSTLNEVFKETPADLTIDLSDLVYIDSTGLGVIIGAYGTIKKDGYKISLVKPKDNVKKLLRITNMDKVLLA